MSSISTSRSTNAGRRRGCPGNQEAKKVTRFWGGGLVLVLVVAALFALSGGASSGGNPRHALKDAATGALQPAVLTASLNGKTVQKQMPFLSDSAIITAKAALNNEEEDKAVAADTASGAD